MVKQTLSGSGSLVVTPGRPLMPNALQQAFGHFNAGRWAEADRIAGTVLAVHPQDASALNLRGCVALNSARYEEAISFLERACSAEPRDPLLRFNLGQAHRRALAFSKALAHYKKAVRLKPDFAEAHAQMGDVLRALGRATDAASAYRAALAIRPELAVALNGLGLLAQRSGDLRQAVSRFEAALAVTPAREGAARATLWTNLGRARLELGMASDGIEALVEAVTGAPEHAEHWRLLAGSLHNLTVVPSGPRFRAVLLALFERDDINPRLLATAAVLTLKRDPALTGLLDEIVRAPDRAEHILQEHSATLAALAQDALFLSLLSHAPIPDVGLELLLTGLRRRHLLSVTAPMRHGAVQDGLDLNGFDLTLTCALARQCFLNEYVYLTSPEEAAALAGLLATLDRAPFGSADSDWTALALAACYVGLHETSAARKSLAGAPEPLRAVIREQIEEPRQERLLRETVEALRPVRDAVSLAVQSQYEENPYPRWTRCQISTPRPLRDVVRAALPHLGENELPDTDTPRVLVAGCGTGLQTMNVLNAYRNAAVLAVDVSRASLAYGMRKLAESGLGSVRHVHVDILDLAMLEERFDLVECFGVLHHMRDPERGLEVLTKLVRPGGLLFLGLYSEMARQSVVAARALITERRYPATPAGVRAARREMMTDTTPSRLGDLLSPASDFWTLSECRDLIFHVEEHRFTLLQIEAMLARLDLTFLGLELRHSADRQRFAADYPGPVAARSLPIWHVFETRYPDTFGDTYRLWARRGRTPASRGGA